MQLPIQRLPSFTTAWGNRMSWYLLAYPNQSFFKEGSSTLKHNLQSWRPINFEARLYHESISYTALESIYLFAYARIGVRQGSRWRCSPPGDTLSFLYSHPRLLLLLRILPKAKLHIERQNCCVKQSNELEILSTFTSLPRCLLFLSLTRPSFKLLTKLTNWKS